MKYESEELGCFIVRRNIDNHKVVLSMNKGDLELHLNDKDAFDIAKSLLNCVNTGYINVRF